MKRLYLFLASITLLFPLFGQALAESVSAGEGWNSSAGWKSAYEKLVTLEQADKIAKAKGGFYDGFNTYTYYISSTTVGNLVSITNSEIGSVKTINCGNVVSQNHLTGSGSNNTKVKSASCMTGGER
mgnify:CR=1 FL=1